MSKYITCLLSVFAFIALVTLAAGPAQAAQNHKSTTAVYGNSHNNYKAGAGNYGPSHDNYNGTETFGPGDAYSLSSHNHYTNHSANDYGSSRQASDTSVAY